MRFFKSNNFCLKVRFSQAQHAISDFFSKTGVFHMRLFQFFSSKSPSIFTKNETFCDSKGLVKVFGTMRLQKNCRCPSKKFSKIFSKNFGKFLKKIFPSIFCFFLRFSVEEDGFFAVFSWGRMIFETYAQPFGYFLAL